jgi:NADH-quinone oxidoreductase subunit N
LLSVVNDFTMLYIAIELQSLSFYLLASFWRSSEYSNEAGIKYFVLGSFSSCILRLGIALIYLSLGSLNFIELSKITIFFSTHFDISYLGLFLILVAFLFKLGAVPFHFWVLDVYEGSIIPVTAFFSVVPKAILLCMLLKLIYSIFSPFTWFFSSFFLLTGLSSIVLASIAAIYQKKIKRLLAYSAISHIGFMILALSCYSLDSIKSVIIYIALYIFANISIFSLLLNSTSKGSILKYLINWSYLTKWNLTIAITFSLILFSLEWITTLSGFYAKMNLLLCLVVSYNIIVPLLVVTFSCIGCFYYIRLIRVLFFVKQKRNSFLLFDFSRSTDICLVFFTTLVSLFLLEPNLLASLASLVSTGFFE